MLSLLKTYRHRLTNLSSSNRSLVLFKLSASQDIDVKLFDFLLNKPAFNIVESLVKGHALIPVCEYADSRNERNNEVSDQLKSIYRREKFIFEERGSRDLVLAWPWVEGKFSDGTPCRCPLVFFPVTLESNGKNWHLKPSEEPFINKSFLLAYSEFNKIAIPENLLDGSLDECNHSDATAFLTSLYELFKNSPVEINFNRELYELSLQEFAEYRKAEFIDKNGSGMLKLAPNAVLGIFPQADSYQVPDYNQLISENKFAEPEDFFATFIQPDSGTVKEENTCTAYPCDASQEEAIKQVKKGHSVVIQGPPGSGKSQLICNLISDYTAKGKKVLVVSQKRAALDVVEKRLSEKSAGEFIANIHDFKNDRKALFHKIDSQIEATDKYKKDNSTLDAIQLERDFTTICRKLEQIVNELEQFKHALFTEADYGVSIKELYLKKIVAKTVAEIADCAKHFQFSTFNTFISNLNTYVFYIRQLKENAYSTRVSFAGISTSEKTIFADIMNELSGYSEKHLNTFFPNPAPALFEELVLTETLLQKASAMLNDSVSASIYRDIVSRNITASNVKKVFNDIYKQLNEGTELVLPISECNELIIYTENYLQKANSFFSLTVWKLFSTEKKPIVTYLGREPLHKSSVQSILKKFRNRVELEDKISTYKTEGWQLEQCSITNKKSFSETETRYIELIKLKEEIEARFARHAELNQHIAENTTATLLSYISSYKQKKTYWTKYISEAQQKDILNDNFNKEKYAEWITQHFDLLTEADKIAAGFSAVEKKIVDILSAQEPELDNWVTLCTDNITPGWINLIEEKHQELKIISTGKVQLLEKELKELISKKQELSTRIWLLRLSENTYNRISYNRLLNPVTYRELKHQVSKKRGLWPVRKLVEHFHEELFNLVPCWLASPETVSAIFPVLPLFDLVIFDEASQCFTEKGIPAMLRGKQVVIAGDKQQLQPSDLYQVRFSQGDEENPLLEIDSLLDFVSGFLPTHTLQGHYRSCSLDLISFSNKYFYNNRLSLVPHIDTLNNYSPAISYIKTNGTWENNSNIADAERTVEELFSLLNKGKESIGIVTFNYHQQNLILDLIDRQKGNRIIPEKVFVKNIENIQGDERDIIIFSIAYAPDRNNRITAGFGLLNQQNGENRLNVAITRAKEQVIIVSSVWPNQLAVEDTLHEGPKFFKKYLEYSLQVHEGNFSTSAYLPDTIDYKGRSLKEILLKENRQFVNELPFADLAEKENNKYLLLIYTDDNRLYSQSVKDFFGYTPQAVEKMGWKYQRKWSKRIN